MKKIEQLEKDKYNLENDKQKIQFELNKSVNSSFIKKHSHILLLTLCIILIGIILIIILKLMIQLKTINVIKHDNNYPQQLQIEVTQEDDIHNENIVELQKANHNEGNIVNEDTTFELNI